MTWHDVGPWKESMQFFRRKMPASAVAGTIMTYALAGHLDGDADSRLALGLHGIPAHDGEAVLPDTASRASWNQISARDEYIIGLEKIFLRAFVGTVCVEAFVKNEAKRKLILSQVRQFWEVSTRSQGPNYVNLFEDVCKIYGILLVLPGLSNDDAKLSEAVGKQFAENCNPFGVLGEGLCAELQQTGQDIFGQAAETMTKVIESVLKRHRLTDG